MKYKAIFFDLDGTLMNTSEGIYAAGRYAMQQCGLEIPEDQDWSSFIGPPLGDCFRLTFGIKDDVLITRLCEHFHDYYAEKGHLMADFYPGIPQLLMELKSRGYLLGITSMKNEDMVQAMCRHFGMNQYFQLQLGIDLTGTMTKGDLLKRGFGIFGLKNSDCVLVGDTYFDQKGAEDAGCPVIRVNWGFGFLPGTPGTISSPEQILNLV